jgi:hypothetical protein
MHMLKFLDEDSSNGVAHFCAFRKSGAFSEWHHSNRRLTTTLSRQALPFFPVHEIMARGPAFDLEFWVPQSSVLEGGFGGEPRD